MTETARINPPLRRERERRCWSQQYVAERIGTTPLSVSRWERGVTVPTLYYRQALCTLYGKSSHQLGFTPAEEEDQQPSYQDDTESSNESAQPLSRRHRQCMLRKVHDFWIAGVLEQSLRGTSLLTLGLQTRRDAVVNPWVLVVPQAEPVPEHLPDGTHISQVYDEVGGALLILGQPGSGKTTLLLELARILLARASQEETHPIPVIFNLSSWSLNQRFLSDWLVDELHTKYQVPRKLAQSWVTAEQILPLLDGLDKVHSAAQIACIETINAYRQEHGLLPMVVCSRQADYFAQPARLLLQRAIALTDLQIGEYLASGGDKGQGRVYCGAEARCKGDLASATK